jgi:AraC-like DNA-binding protein
MNVSQSSNKDRRLLHLIADKLVPWTALQQTPWLVATGRRRDLHPGQAIRMTPRKMQGKEIASGGARRYRNTSTVVRRWPEDHLNAAKMPKLACVLSGYADLQFYDYELHLPESTFIFIPPDVPQPDGSLSHVSSGNTKGFCDICWIMPMGDKLHFWICRSEGKTHFTLQWSNILFLNQRLNLYLRLLHEEVMAANKIQPLLIPQLLHLLMLGLQRETNAGSFLQFGQDIHPSWRLQTSVDPVAQAQDYIDAHYGSAITLESLARIVGMSRSLFAQRFKKETGQTMGEYLTTRRLQEAKNLLRQSEWTVSTISGFVGFHSQNHFYNWFRKQENCSPSEFRKTYQDQNRNSEIQTIS